MKKMNKKGFTIVELVIVIAVIAILAAVMIPTFGGIIKKANKSSVEQTATAAYKEAYGLALSDGKIVTEGTDKDEYTINDYKFTFGGTIDSVTCTVTDSKIDGFEVKYDGGKIVVTEAEGK